MSWPTTPTRFILTEVDERGLRDGDDGELLSVSEHRGVVPRRESASQQAASEDVSHYKRCEPGQLVLNKLWAFRGGLGVSPFTGLVSPAYAVYDINPSMHPGFVHYQTRSAWFVAEMTKRLRGIGSPDASVGRAPHLNTSELGRIDMHTPPLDTQRRIADMLDAETVRIDTLIEKNERVLRTAITREKVAVSEAIGSAGLQPGRWRTGALRWFDVDIQTGPFGSQLHADEYVIGGWPVCNPSNIRDGRLVADESVTIGEEAWNRLSRHHLRAGDIIFGRRGEMGRAALVTDDEQGWVCGTGCLLVRLRSQNRYLPEFLMEVLSSWGVRAWFDKKSVGSTMQNLNETVLGSLPVPAVPINEQRDALEAIRSIRERHARIRTAVERQQELLRLRRQALITAAVTGQIEV